ncbi:hypothetical protein LBMAG53_09340 [Planctomycetota bacterium]|nr:hypothetical protein LBMAG53_09340 [Planctomycetota bacterium]
MGFAHVIRPPLLRWPFPSLRVGTPSRSAPVGVPLGARGDPFLPPGPQRVAQFQLRPAALVSEVTFRQVFATLYHGGILEYLHTMQV